MEASSPGEGEQTKEGNNFSLNKEAAATLK